MIAVLRYKEGIFTNDGNVVFKTIAKNNTEIIGTTTFLCNGKPKVKIKFDSFEQLNKIVQEINSRTAYEVSVIKVKNNIFRKRGIRQ